MNVFGMWLGWLEFFFFYQGGEEENFVSQEGVPPGYEAVSLLEALNGPYQNNSVLMQMSHEG